MKKRRKSDFSGATKQKTQNKWVSGAEPGQGATTFEKDGETDVHEKDPASNTCRGQTPQEVGAPTTS